MWLTCQYEALVFRLSVERVEHSAPYVDFTRPLVEVAPNREIQGEKEENVR
jgi:hypothetical protein